METRSQTKIKPNQPEIKAVKIESVKLSIKIPSPKSRIEIPETKIEKFLEKKRREILGFRATNSQLSIEDNHKIKRLKTALLIDQDRFPGSIENVKSEKLNNILSHRPILKITNVSRANSPVSVMTPRGSELPRVARFGSLSLFSNETQLKPIIDLNPVKKINEKSSFFNSESYESVLKTDQLEKNIETTITLKKRKKEDYDNALKRSVSQNWVMAEQGVSERKASATDYAYATKLFENDNRWEWLHLVAHRFGGKKSQTEDNLVAATAYSNTEMMFAEAGLNYLAEVYPDGFNLRVKAILIPTTQIATAIYYTIKTPDFEITHEFNTQTKNKPNCNYQTYFNFFVNEVVDAVKLTKQKNKNVKPEIKSDIFYSKNDMRKNKVPVINEIKSQEELREDKFFIKPKRTVVIDTETTGLYIDKGDRVVEIGGVEILDGKVTGKKFRHIINPDGQRISKSAQKIHGITQEVVQTAPKFSEIADQFCEFIKDAEIIGHNLPFDLTMLENEFRLAKRSDTFAGRYATDTLAELEKLQLKEKKLLKSYKLSNACQFFGINISSREKGHGALIDSRLTAELHLCLQKESQKLFAKRKNQPIKTSLPTKTSSKTFK